MYPLCYKFTSLDELETVQQSLISSEHRNTYLKESLEEASELQTLVEQLTERNNYLSEVRLL